jgi:hypothetical protein
LPGILETAEGLDAAHKKSDGINFNRFVALSLPPSTVAAAQNLLY